ncbi:hypothetical protein FRB98_003763 [Tulasnella sp. 332]|nr:hypothetical protein FRB98_003763 [Tulasnella sp. 332]
MVYAAALLGNLLFASAALAAPSSRLAARLERRREGRQSQPINRLVPGISQAGEVSNEQYSSNWAGAVYDGTPAGTFKSVTGTFVVPTPKAASGQTSGSASAWVGIDGDTCGNAILQTGVDFTVTNGKVSYDAWYEWYPDYAYDFSGITISAGDSITTTVTATSTKAGTAVIKNNTTGKTVTKSLTSSYALCEQNAEWIVEDYEEGSSLVTMANFGTVTFTGASAGLVSGGSEGPSGASLIDIEQNSKFLPPGTPKAAASEEDLESLFEDLFASSPISNTTTGWEHHKLTHPTTPSKDVLLALDKLKDRLAAPRHVEVGGVEIDMKSSPVPLQEFVSKSHVLGEEAPSQRMSHDAVDALVEEEQQPIAGAYIDVLGRLEAAIISAEEALPTSSTTSKAKLSGSLNLATETEWDVLLQAAVDSGDHTSARRVLELMERSGEKVQLGLQERLLKSCGHAGDIVTAEGLIQGMKDRGLVITEQQRHLHVQTFISARQYFAAQSLVHSYEGQNLIPAERTYRTLIQALFSSPPTSPMATRYRALGWDLFSHMRYVAHPTPSAETYTAMIRACADAMVPSAERALDLFHEMTMENRIRPTVETYNAVMLTCARSPKRKQFAHETFRLGKQLLDEYRHMSVTSPEAAEAKRQMRPTLETFKAMLESAKRTGDLARGRWILAELIQARECVDEELMGHVFHLYAAFKPPFVRRQVVLQEQSTGDVPVSPPSEASDLHTESESASLAEVEDEPAFVPQTRSEILREAEAVFHRLVNGMELGSWGGLDDEQHPDWIFSRVKMTTNLLNAYLAVQCNHGSGLKTAVDTFNTLYLKYQCPPNGQAFATILERLALVGKRGEDRAFARRAAEEIWKEWIEMCDKMEARAKQAAHMAEQNISARRVEKMWATMIRIATLSGDTQRGVELVKHFHMRYPPQAALPPNDSASGRATTAVSVSTMKPPSISPPTKRLPAKSFPTRVALEATRQPLVRLTTNSQIPDNTIPPFLTFEDVEVLHHRLVVESTSGPLEDRKARVGDVKYLTWVCRSYGGALQKRKNWMQSGRLQLERELRQYDRYRIDMSSISIEPKVIPGGFGSVRRGHVQTTGEVVAIKTLRSTDESMYERVALVGLKSFSGLPSLLMNMVQRLLREMAAWAELEHPNIVPFRGFYLSDTYDEAILVSAYAENGDIMSYLARTGVKDIQRLKLVMDTLEGLKYLHCHEPVMYHGDLKAANILVNREGHAVICDLGLAKALDSDARFATSSDFRGSTHWCAPELWNGEGRSLQSDMWSWGCLVLEVMRGIMPYAGLSHFAVIRSVTDGTLPADLKALESPMDLRRILEPCWRRDPPQRADVIQCYREVTALYYSHSVNVTPQVESLEVIFGGDRAEVEAGTVDGLIHYALTQSPASSTLQDFRSIFLATFTTFTTAEVLSEILKKQYGGACYHDFTIQHHKTDVRFNVLKFIEDWLFNHETTVGSLEVMSKLQNFVSGIRRPERLGVIARQLDWKLLSLKASTPAIVPFVVDPRGESAGEWLSKRTPMIFANILTHIESRLYTAIRPAEQVPRTTMHEFKIIAWIKSVVLEKAGTKERAEIIEFFISTATECWKLGNFPAVRTIVLALSSSVVTNLRHTREAVREEAVKQLRSLDDLTDVTGNFERYRANLVGRTLPIIPIIHVHLGIIATNNGGSTYPSTVQGTTGSLINFKKYAKLYETIQGVLCYQDTPHEIQPDMAELRWFQNQLRGIVLNDAFQEKLVKASELRKEQDEVRYRRMSDPLKDLWG